MVTALVERCAGFRVVAVDSPTSAAKFSLRALARRYLFLTDEMVAQGKLLDALTREVAPRLREGYCISRLGRCTARRVRRQRGASAQRSGFRQTVWRRAAAGVLGRDDASPASTGWV